MEALMHKLNVSNVWINFIRSYNRRNNPNQTALTANNPKNANFYYRSRMPSNYKQNDRLSTIIFIICLLFLFIATSVFGQELSNNMVLSREKQGNNWITQGCLWKNAASDSIIISTYSQYYAFGFTGIIVELTGEDKMVRDVVLSIYFENGTSMFLGARPGTYNHGTSWFDLTEYERLKIKTMKVKKIEIFNRYTNHIKQIDNWEWQYFLVATKS